MSKYFFKFINQCVTNEGYSLTFSRKPLAPGEHGKGLYFIIKAKDKDSLYKKLKRYDFTKISGYAINPVGEVE